MRFRGKGVISMAAYGRKLALAIGALLPKKRPASYTQRQMLFLPTTCNPNFLINKIWVVCNIFDCCWLCLILFFYLDSIVLLSPKPPPTAENFQESDNFGGLLAAEPPPLWRCISQASQPILSISVNWQKLIMWTVWTCVKIYVNRCELKNVPSWVSF